MEFQHLFSNETACARHLDLQELLRRRIGTYESREIRRACANRIGMDSTTAKLTEYEIERNKKISKSRYIVEQYFGLSHLHTEAKLARFTTSVKNKFDDWCRQAAFNIIRGLKILRVSTV